MSNAVKTWLIVAALLIAVGILICGIVLAVLEFDFTRLDTHHYETNCYGVEEDFQNITICTAMAQVRFAPSEDGTCRVECLEEDKLKHSVAVRDGTLIVESVDSRKWYDYIGISFQSAKITVYLPETVLDTVYIDTQVGHVDIPQVFSVKNLEISTKTGNAVSYAAVSDSLRIHTATGSVWIGSVDAEGVVDVETDTGGISMENVRCEQLSAKCDTGYISLKNVIASGRMQIENVTGSVELKGVDAASIFVKTSTGSVTGTVLSEKIFTAQSSTGSISVPQSTSGGTCEVFTGTGHIHLRIEN